MLTRFHIVTLAIVTVVVAGDAFQTPPPAWQWPPAVQKISMSAPVRSPAEALATFSLPPGYRLELVASEPLIQDPILIDWDTVGTDVGDRAARLHAQHQRRPGEYDPTGRIVVLEDTERDGTMDKRTVFADGLIQPRALKVLDRGVLVGEPPNVWLLTDTDRRPACRRKELVTSGYGRQGDERRGKRQRPVLGPRQPDLRVGDWRRLLSSVGRTASSRCSRRCRAVSGERRRTTRDASTATTTSRCCTSIWCPRRTTRAIRTCCARAAATKRSSTPAATSTPCGRRGRRLAPTARISMASCARTVRWPLSRPPALRRSIEAIDFPRIYRETFSSRSPRRISSAASC